MEQFSKQKTLDLRGGLFLIKYESAESHNLPPKVMISVDPESKNAIELILPPSAADPILWAPGACLIARSKNGGRLRVAVTPSHPNGSIVARIQVIALSNDPMEAHGHPSAKALAPEAPVVNLDLSSFRVVGHVAGLGDVFADGESWIAGPMAPSRIEGISIEWPARPTNFGLCYAVRVGGQRPTTTELVEAGKFAGTRGRALPLVGATVEISGPAAGGHQLAVDGLFLGSPQVRVTGQRIVLSGPSGLEPLVGLRVRLERLSAGVWPARGSEGKTPIERAGNAELTSAAPLGYKPPPSIPGRPTGRVRVFRSAKKRGAASPGA